jgi:hypothetical protein
LPINTVRQWLRRSRKPQAHLNVNAAAAAKATLLSFNGVSCHGGQRWSLSQSNSCALSSAQGLLGAGVSTPNGALQSLTALLSTRPLAQLNDSIQQPATVLGAARPATPQPALREASRPLTNQSTNAVATCTAPATDSDLKTNSVAVASRAMTTDVRQTQPG